MGRLDGRSVLVTGGGSGLGHALVRRFVEDGARVTVLDRSEPKLSALREAFGTGVRTLAGDVTSFADNQEAADLAVREFGALDTFVGNAGVWDFGRSLLDASPDELGTGFDELFSVNVKGYLLGAKAAAPHLKSSRGSMIFTLSNAAFFPGGGGPLYVSSKHAGVGLVRQLAYELAPEVRVNAVAPGGMATDLRGPGAMGLADRSVADAIPIRQMVRDSGALQIEVEPDDYVGAYLYLACRDDSATVTGTVVDVSSWGTPKRTGAV